MTISATFLQLGWEFPVGVAFQDQTTANLVLDDAPGPVGSLQFTVPTDQLWRSFDLTITPMNAGPDFTGTLTVSFVNEVDLQLFSVLNFPSNANLIQVYSEEVTFVVDTPVVIPVPLTIDPLQANSGVGSFDSDSIMSVIRHSDFEGVVGFVLTLADASTTAFHSWVAPGIAALRPTLVGDNTPALFSGLPTGHHRQSRADSCPRCGTPIFREQLIPDGYTKTLVCEGCWDRGEQKYPLPKHLKEINP